jgi:hypothetical protein
MRFHIFFVMLATGCASVHSLPVSDVQAVSDRVSSLEHTLSHLPVAVPCGELTVKVDKLDVDMPDGGSLDMMGMKGSTPSYHLVLQGAQFTKREYCSRE